MKLFTAPEYSCYSPHPSVFLAGSIEMDTAVDWQKVAIQELKGLDVVVFNPRRAAWDPTWEQSEDNPEFVDQVTWELFHLNASAIPFFYFAPGTKSPISLMELGLVAGETCEESYATGAGAIVVCPKEFWRSGNVAIVCKRYHIPVYHDLDSGLKALKERINFLNDTLALKTPRSWA